MAGSLLGVRISRTEEQSLMFQPRDHKHTWIINLWLFYMANPSAPQTAISFQFKASLGSTDLPSEDIVWMLILTFCSTLVCDSTFPSAGFKGPMESGKTELCQTPGAWHQSGQCTRAGRECWECQTVFLAALNFTGGNCPVGTLHQDSAAALTQPEVAAGPQKAQRGLSFTGGAAATCAVAVSCHLQEHSQISWEARTASVLPELSPCPAPSPGQSKPGLPGHSPAFLRLPEPRYTWRHNTTLVHWPLTLSHQMFSADVVGLLH